MANSQNFALTGLLIRDSLMPIGFLLSRRYSRVVSARSGRRQATLEVERASRSMRVL